MGKFKIIQMNIRQQVVTHSLRDAPENKNLSSYLESWPDFLEENRLVTNTNNHTNTIKLQTQKNFLEVDCKYIY